MKAAFAAAMIVATLAICANANGIHDANGNILKGLAESELIMGRAGKLGDQKPTIGYWAETPTKERGDVPYPYPKVNFFCPSRTMSSHFDFLLAEPSVQHEGRSCQGQDQRPPCATHP